MEYWIPVLKLCDPVTYANDALGTNRSDGVIQMSPQ